MGEFSLGHFEFEEPGIIQVVIQISNSAYESAAKRKHLSQCTDFGGEKQWSKRLKKKKD